MLAKRLLHVLQSLAATDIKNRRAGGFEYLGSRVVVCGSEHAFRLPMGYSAYDVEKHLGVLMGAVGAAVELIDRKGAIVIRVVTKDFPIKGIPFKKEDIKETGILMGYNRLFQPIYHPLNTHLLVGGASSSGKTVWLHNTIYTLQKQGYRVLICDLKGISFFAFETLPQVAVIDNINDGYTMLESIVSEIEHRKNIIKRHRNLQLMDSFQPVALIVDEGAVFSPSQNTGKDKTTAQRCENLIAYIGQQARQFRIFSILCYQRPDKDVINLQYKANVEATMCFRTKDKYNSKIIMDREGAEQISPTTPGRCFYYYDREHYLQVPYVGDDRAWNKLLRPLKTEVLQNGSSKRTEARRHYIEGAVERANGDRQTTGDAQQQLEPLQESVRDLATVGRSKVSPMGVSPQTKTMETEQKRKVAAGSYSDEID